MRFGVVLGQKSSPIKPSNMEFDAYSMNPDTFRILEAQRSVTDLELSFEKDLDILLSPKHLEIRLKEKIHF